MRSPTRSGGATPSEETSIGSTVGCQRYGSVTALRTLPWNISDCSSITELAKRAFEKHMDLLLPTTDAGVAAQVVIATIVFAGLLWRLWANKDARIFVIGMAMLTFGAMGVRALH